MHFSVSVLWTSFLFASFWSLPSQHRLEFVKIWTWLLGLAHMISIAGWQKLGTPLLGFLVCESLPLFLLLLLLLPFLLLLLQHSLDAAGTSVIHVGWWTARAAAVHVPRCAMPGTTSSTPHTRASSATVALVFLGLLTPFFFPPLLCPLLQIPLTMSTISLYVTDSVPFPSV